MPDLGKYALEVTLAYGVSLSLLALLVLFYWQRARSVEKKLREVEARQVKEGED